MTVATRPVRTRHGSASTTPSPSVSQQVSPAPQPPPPSAAGKDGIPVVDDIVVLHDFLLEGGEVLDEVQVHYRLEGAVSAARDNVVLVVHALTGTAQASAWWQGVVGLGEVIDPARHAVLCAALLGGCDGTTGPRNSDPDALPPITTRDQAALLARVLDHLDLHHPVFVCGGSLGGMVTLEFAASFPERVRGAVVLAAPAAQTAQGLAWNAIMRRAIALGGTRDGLALARMVGMLSYRTPESLERRFGRAQDAAGRFQVNTWLDAHGERLVARFDATSYGALIDAMDQHDVGRGRGGVAAALAPVADRLTAVGIPGDLLYPDHAVREWSDAVHAGYVELPSAYGHDAFLLETARVSRIIGDALARASAWAATHQRVVGDVISGAVTDGVTTDAPFDHATAPHTAAPSRTTPLRVALAGCGHVGGGLLQLLAERQATSRDVRSARTPIVVPRVLVRDATRARPALAQAIAQGIARPDACITNPEALLGDDIDILVEAIGGTGVAANLVDAALARGLRVITANKALLGERGASLLAAANAQHTTLDFEGAVCGAIPIVRCVRRGAAGVGITGITGILNGTSNFVLEQLTAGQSFHEAIATAQNLGYAEADPTRDLNGQDAEDKLRILAWLAFGIAPHALEVRRRGIDADTAAWAREVAAAGDRVKLLASVRRVGTQLHARIEPTRVRGDDAWAQVTGPFNRIVVDSASAGSLVFQGPGAGGIATAGAVLSDLLSYVPVSP